MVDQVLSRGAGALADVREQPEVIARLIDREWAAVGSIARRLRRKRLDYVLVAGRGSSDNAARYAHYLFGAECRMPVATASPSLFTRYGAPPRLDGALVIAVSQSGASADVLEVVREARRQGRPTIAITNTAGSPIAEAAEHVLELHAGEEQPGVATKTYLASLGAFAMLASALGHRRPAEDLRSLPDRIAEVVAGMDAPVAAAADLVASATHATVVGRGYNYATSHEVALKLTMLTRTAASAYSAADVIRGPGSEADDVVPAFILGPSGRVLSDIFDVVPSLRARGTPLVVCSDVPELLDEGDVAIPLPGHVREWLSPLVAAVPGQLLALEVARRQATLDVAGT